MKMFQRLKGKTKEDYINYLNSKFWNIINQFWFCALSLRPVDQKLIVLESNGDCCDNAYAFFDYLCSSGVGDKYHFVWLVDHKQNFVNSDRIKYVTKRPHPLYDIDTMHALATCRWYVFDHVNAFANLKKRKGQSVTYLCHGYAGFKAKKGYNKLKVDSIITTGDIPLQGCYDFFGKECNTVVLGFSRLDYFYSNNNSQLAKELFECSKFKKNLIWMPTFRKSKIKCISEDYLDDTETGLPLLETEEDFLRFNSFLRRESIQVIIKIHPLQEEFEFFKQKFSNIKIIDNDYLSKNGIQLYQTIPVFDALITDYSSVSTDYLMLEKPIIYILDDIDEYKQSRGLYPDNPLEYMPGRHVYSYEQFEQSVLEILIDKDEFVESRRALMPLFHKYQDGFASKRIAEYLGIE